MFRAHTASLFAAIALFLSGCVHHLTPPVSPTNWASPKLPMTVALVVPPSVAAKQDTWGRYYNLGIIHEWVCDTGAAMVPALQQSLSELFTDVHLVDSAEKAGEAQLVLEPVALEVHSTETWDYAFSVRLRVTAKDASGEVIADRTYEENGVGNSNAAFWGGPFLADEVLARPTGEAMAKVITRFVRDAAALSAEPAVTPAPL